MAIRGVSFNENDYSFGLFFGLLDIFWIIFWFVLSMYQFEGCDLLLFLFLLLLLLFSFHFPYSSEISAIKRKTTPNRGTT